MFFHFKAVVMDQEPYSLGTKVRFALRQSDSVIRQ